MDLSERGVFRKTQRDSERQERTAPIRNPAAHRPTTRQLDRRLSELQVHVDPGLARLRTMDFAANLDIYLGDRAPTSRYASFDYCFNYFQQVRDSGGIAALRDPERLQTSCLQLGFYLASWGMFRGSAQLPRYSLRCFTPVINAIIDAPEEIWEVDAHDYSVDSISVILDVRRTISAALPGGHSDTLVTKVMLGVFGCVPAFDTYFKRGLGVATFGRKSLERIAQTYEAHRATIEHRRVRTLDFETGRESDRCYTRAKLIDMALFIEGRGAL